MKLSLTMTSRWAFFAIAGLAFGSRDMCFGGGGPPPPPPEDPPADASDDGPMSERPVAPQDKLAPRT